MRHLNTVAAILTAMGTMAAAPAAMAQDQEVKRLQCQSGVGQRSSCSAGGEILNAGIVRVNSETPCILGYTWGFEENGIWTGGGCSADFEVTIVTQQAQAQVNPDRLKERLRESRRTIRDLRKEVGQERQARQAIEAELSEAQAQLAQVGKPAAASKGAKNWVVQSIAACSRTSLRDARNSGAKKPRIAEILSARPTEGAWLVVGRLTAEAADGGRKPSYFRCWVEKGQVRSYENSI